MIKLKKSKGFTLIELLVALSIVTIILLAFFKVIDNTTKMNVKNDIDIKALKLAKSEVENLRNQIKNGEDVISRDYIKSIDNKNFKVYLDITKSDVNNTNITNEMYMYTINIKVKSLNKDFSEDKYFSKKETKIQDVKILSKNKS